MTIYLNINETTELYFPFETFFDEVDLTFVNDQTKNTYVVEVPKELRQYRGWTALVKVTGIESEPTYTTEDNITTINIPAGNYTLTIEDSDGVERIIMVHILTPTTQEITYTDEQKNKTYE